MRSMLVTCAALRHRGRRHNKTCCVGAAIRCSIKPKRLACDRRTDRAVPGDCVRILVGGVDRSIRTNGDAVGVDKKRIACAAFGENLEIRSHAICTRCAVVQDLCVRLPRRDDKERAVRKWQEPTKVLERANARRCGTDCCTKRRSIDGETEHGLGPRGRVGRAGIMKRRVPSKARIARREGS